jgi:MFS family permease
VERDLTGTQPKIFYGWRIVFAAALALCLGGPPIAVFSFSVFFKSLVSDFHASRAAISFAFTLHNLASVSVIPLLGRLIDRFGARRVILPVTVALSLVLFSGKMLGSSLWQFYAFYAALGLLGIGTSAVPYGVVVSHWFNRRRGLALGCMMLGAGVGGIVVPLFAQTMIAEFGWRTAYAIYGMIVLLVPLPVVAALLENDPAARGLLADGADPKQSRSHRLSGNEGFSWHEIWHSPTYWLMLGAFFLAGASVHAGVLHIPALLMDRGLSAERASLATSVIGLSLLTGRFGSGYLLDRFFAPRVAIAVFSGSALGLAVLCAGSTGNIALGAAFLVGLGMGAEADIIAYLLSRYFGLRALGTSYAYAFGTFVLAGAAGALLMGAGYDWTRSYTAPLIGFVVAMMFAIALLTRLGPYRYAVEPEANRALAPAHAASA